MKRSARPMVVFVVPRYGSQVRGGAETHCRMVAERMSQWWDIQVLTTCATDYLTWRNDFPPGESEVNGVRVRRFPTAVQRDMNEFAALTNRLEGEDGSALERDWMRMQGPDSPELISELKNLGDSADLIVFFSYLYSTTFFGLPLVRDKAVLVPMAHDEPPLRLGIFEELFDTVPYLLYNTPEEAHLLRSRFRLGPERGEVVGVGIAPIDADPPAPNPQAGERYGIYIGRVDYPKGVADLFHYYAKNDLMKELNLVVVGQANFEIPKIKGIHHYESPDDSLKNALLRDAIVLFQPSRYESLSMSALESWMAGIPVLANGECAVLRGQCERSGGGWVYFGEMDFVARTRSLARLPARRSLLGLRGKRYVTHNYRWPRIEACYRSLLGNSNRGAGFPTSSEAGAPPQ